MQTTGSETCSADIPARSTEVSAELLAGLMQAFTHLLFDDDGLPVFGGCARAPRTGRRPALIPVHGIPPTQVTAANHPAFHPVLPARALRLSAHLSAHA